MSELEQFFNSSEECTAYETFCAEQERGLENFELAQPALVCRWRMANRQVPLLNRHIRALAARTVNGAKVSTNMVSWAKQHVECSLADGTYEDSNGVLMLTIDVNGDAAMAVGPYETLVDCAINGLIERARLAHNEADSTSVAPELLACMTADNRLIFGTDTREALCGSASLVEQLSSTKGISIERMPFDQLVTAIQSDELAESVVLLVSDEHGVVLADQISSAAEPEAPKNYGAAAKAAIELAHNVAKLFA